MKAPLTLILPLGILFAQLCEALDLKLCLTESCSSQIDGHQYATIEHLAVKDVEGNSVEMVCQKSPDKESCFILKVDKPNDVRRLELLDRSQKVRKSVSFDLSRIICGIEVEDEHPIALSIGSNGKISAGLSCKYKSSPPPVETEARALEQLSRTPPLLEETPLKDEVIFTVVVVGILFLCFPNSLMEIMTSMGNSF